MYKGYFKKDKDKKNKGDASHYQGLTEEERAFISYVIKLKAKRVDDKNLLH